jgi:hypothetical protein
MNAISTRKWRTLVKTTQWCSVEQESVLQPLQFHGLPSSQYMKTEMRRFVLLWFYLLVKCYCLVIFITRAGREISRILLSEALKSVEISGAVIIMYSKTEVPTVHGHMIQDLWVFQLTFRTIFLLYIFTGNTFFFSLSLSLSLGNPHFNVIRSVEPDRLIQSNDWLMTGQGEEGRTNCPKIYIPTCGHNRIKNHK